METITFDPRSLEDCERAVARLKATIRRHHGPGVIPHLFLKDMPSQRSIKANQNLLILARYIASGLSVQRYAKEMAERYKTNPKALDKHIRRLKNQVKRLGAEHYEALERAVKKQP